MGMISLGSLGSTEASGTSLERCMRDPEAEGLSVFGIWEQVVGPLVEGMPRLISSVRGKERVMDPDEFREEYLRVALEYERWAAGVENPLARHVGMMTAGWAYAMSACPHPKDPGDALIRLHPGESWARHEGIVDSVASFLYSDSVGGGEITDCEVAWMRRYLLDFYVFPAWENMMDEGTDRFLPVYGEEYWRPLLRVYEIALEHGDSLIAAMAACKVAACCHWADWDLACRMSQFAMEVDRTSSVGIGDHIWAFLSERGVMDHVSWMGSYVYGALKLYCEDAECCRGSDFPGDPASMWEELKGYVRELVYKDGARGGPHPKPRLEWLDLSTNILETVPGLMLVCEGQKKPKVWMRGPDGEEWWPHYSREEGQHRWEWEKRKLERDREWLAKKRARLEDRRRR